MTNVTNVTNDKKQTQEKAPVLIDLGKKRRKQIRRLRKGKGKLMDRVQKVVERLKEDGTVSREAETVIVVVRERPRTRLFGF